MIVVTVQTKFKLSTCSAKWKVFHHLSMLYHPPQSTHNIHETNTRYFLQQWVKLARKFNFLTWRKNHSCTIHCNSLKINENCSSQVPNKYEMPVIPAWLIKYESRTDESHLKVHIRWYLLANLDQFTFTPIKAKPGSYMWTYYCSLWREMSYAYTKIFWMFVWSDIETGSI